MWTKTCLLTLCIFSIFISTVNARSKYVSEEEDNPYEFGFTIDGQQHRHEKKDANGIIQGEFGFITADGVYHVTVYATDENGNFRILSMRNIRLSGPLDQPNAQLPDTSQFAKGNPANPPPNALSIPSSTTTAPQTTQSFQFTTQVSIKPACAGCGYVTTKKPIENRLEFQTDAFKNPKPGTAIIGGVYNPNLDIRVGEPKPQDNNFGNYQDIQNHQNVQQQVTNEDSTFDPNYPQNYPENILNFDQQNYPQQNDQQIYHQNDQQNYHQNDQQSYYHQNDQQNYPQIDQQSYHQNDQQNYPQSDQQNYPVDNQNYNGQTEQNYPQDPYHIDPNFPVQASNVPDPIPELNPLAVPEAPGGITIHDGLIDVPNNEPIRIQDKYPGMQEGLPAGITEGDISDLLYKFNYTVGFHGHYEKGYKNGAKVGGYFVNDRDGVSRIVTYVADENGYRPKVKFVRLDLNSDLVPKEGTEKTFGLKNFEFVWYPLK